jgi:hypothetical protein
MFTLGRSTITVFLDAQMHTVDASHANYEPLLAELRKPADERDLNLIRPLLSIKRMIEACSIGKVTIDGEKVFYEGTPINSYLATRMLEILQQGLGIEPWAYFMDNLMKNPSESARNELYEWLEKAKLPLTPDGCFIAFKKVRESYKDCHTGAFDNSVGSIIEMDRALCDPNRNNECSTGFHFASVGYLGHFSGDRVMAVKINPRDVTAIPPDYKVTKGRCCRYEVVAELQSQHAASHGAWSKKAVVDLEDPQELPDLLIKTMYPPAEKTKITGGTKGVVKKTAKAKDQKVTKAKVAKVEEKVKAEGKEAKTFKTTTGAVHTAKAIIAALKKFPATREAARHLGVGESTLRGWKKSLGL